MSILFIMNMTVILITDSVTILSSSQIAESCCFPGSLVPQPCRLTLGPHQVIFHVPGLDPSPREVSRRAPLLPARGFRQCLSLPARGRSQLLVAWAGAKTEIQAHSHRISAPPPLWAEGNLPTPALIAWGLWNPTQFPDPFPPPAPPP